MDDIELITEHLQNVLLTETVREWMVIVNKGLLGNKRVVYSTDSREKVKERFEWYRDMYPDVRFRIMSKSAFRSSYHRFPEYISDKKRAELFGTDETKVRYGQKHVQKKYIFSPKTKDIRVDGEVPVSREVIRTIVKEPQQDSPKTMPQPDEIKVVR